MKLKLLSLLLLIGLAFAAPAAQPTNPTIYRAYFTSAKQLEALTSQYDALEARGKDARGEYVLVIGDDELAAKLNAEGYTLAVQQRIGMVNSPLSFYGGYHTIAEHYAHMDAIITTRPDLAQGVVYGQTWRKLQGQSNGYDLRAICLTKQRPGDCALSPNTDKPRFFLMAAIHARELSTSEMAWRWMDDLVAKYNVDPDVTALLDYNEIWLIPLANPDGRDVVEQGYTATNFPWYQRKNQHAQNPSTCSSPPTSWNQDGIDLNRNASFRWGGVGTSANPCDAVYRGASAASEPEEVALENLVSQLFRDQRGPLDADAAPITTTGAFLTLHSFSNLVLLPWGDNAPNTPNDAALRSFAFRMSSFNGYVTGRPAEVLYGVSGSSDDWAYGTLGIPAFTFEIGPGSGACADFFPPYSCQDSVFWPRNRSAFYFAAKNARQPYESALGPVTLTPTLSSGPVGAGAWVTLTAIVDDGLYGSAAGSVGRPASQVISAAQVFVDAPPWAGGSPIPMTAQDGAFNTARETALAALNTTGLAAGRHTLFIRAQDAGGHWGATTAQWLWVNYRLFLPMTMRLSSANW